MRTVTERRLDLAGDGLDALQDEGVCRGREHLVSMTLSSRHLQTVTKGTCTKSESLTGEKRTLRTIFQVSSETRVKGRVRRNSETTCLRWMLCACFVACSATSNDCGTPVYCDASNQFSQERRRAPAGIGREPSRSTWPISLVSCELH
jgi:hypothetical protein